MNSLIAADQQAIVAAEAADDRTMRMRRHVSNCVLLAVVTSAGVSADLIDRAIELTRTLPPFHADGTEPPAALHVAS
jgi:hypothetical protein